MVFSSPEAALGEGGPRILVSQKRHFWRNFQQIAAVACSSSSRIVVLRSTLMSRSNLRSETGAMLIQVAIALLGLTLFSAFVVDYGIIWTSRWQVPYSADAA